jgi:hypothetical protein
MDPVTVGAVIAAVAGGAGGAVGRQVWDGLCTLVRRPFHRDPGAPQETGRAVLSGGSPELAAVVQAPGDQRRANALAAVLVERADADTTFAEALQSWWEQAQQVDISGNVTNTVSGGNQYGPVLQGRDFTGLTFGTPTSASPGSVQQEDDTS